MVVWSLEGVFDPGGAVRQQRLIHFPLVLGRQPGLDCVISEPSISRKHALVDTIGDTLVITDLSSCNGTYVNRQKVTKPTPLNHGDVIHLGNVALLILHSEKLQCGGLKVDSTDTGNIKLAKGHSPAGLNHLEELLEKKQVQSVFQPVFRASNMQIVGYELLTLGNNSNLPAKPLPLFYLAERFGLAPKLSELMRSQGVLTAMHGGLGGNLLVNAHPWELGDIDRLLASLRPLRASFPHARLTLEIQEHAVTGDIQVLKDLKNELVKMKIGLAFRDFGVCESRLLEMIDAKPDLIKFDKVLIEDIDQADHSRLNLIKHLLELASGLGIRTLAEHVGNQQEFETCKAMGFGYFQGFYLAKPSPMEYFTLPHQQRVR